VADFANLVRLDNRTYVVIGAGQGMGRQAAHALAQNGARIVCVDVDADRAQDIATEVGNDAVAWVGDVTMRESVARLFDDTSKVFGGKLDGFVDIVGIAQYGDLIEIDDDLWDRQFDVNLRHGWLAMQHAAPLIKANGGGTMTFVASVAGHTGAPRHSAYGAAKAALMALVKSAAVELGPYNIRVNAVAPGVVWTPRLSARLGDDGRDRNSQNVPLRRVAQTSDVASALLFFASDLSGYVSGQTLVVDGGVSAKMPYPLDGF
jgi:NAD(P)-dependent dehydrogenase (short-subunit alcohol dehydrogenase family)